MRSRSAVLIAVLAGVATAACGSATPTQSGESSAAATSSAGATSSPSSTPTATPAPAPPLFLVGSNDGSEYLVDGAGTVRAHLPANVQGFRAGPHHLYAITGSTISFYGTSGNKLSSEAFAPGHDPVFAADGKSWFWGGDEGVGGGFDTTKIYMGTPAKGVTLLTTLTSGTETHYVEPVAVRNGVLYLSVARYGADNIFASGSEVWTMRPPSGAYARTRGPACFLEDVADDGSQLCTEGNAVKLYRANGTTVSWTVPGAGPDGIGGGSISADGAHILIKAAVHNPGNYPVNFKLFSGTLSGGAMTFVTVTQNSEPAPFLPDGRAVVANFHKLAIVNTAGAMQNVTMPPGCDYIGFIPHPAD